MGNKYLFTGRDPSKVSLPGAIVNYPLIETEAIPFKVDALGEYDGLIFTSRMAVEAFSAQYKIEPTQKIFAVGPNTRRDLEALGYEVDYIPEIPQSEYLAKFIERSKMGKLLYPTSDISDNRLSLLPNVTTVVAYITKPISQPKVSLNDYSGIIFSSPSTVDSFLSIYDIIPSDLEIYVYGQKTAERLKEVGYTGNIQLIKL